MVLNRSTGSFVVGILIGAAVGAYWMTQADRRTQRTVKNQGIRVVNMARRTAYAMQSSTQRLNPALKAGRAVVSAAVRNLR